MEPEKNYLTLPVGIVTPVDINRLLREVRILDDFLRQAAIRRAGSSSQLPRVSRSLDDLLNTNKLNALLEPDRKRLEEFLASVKAQAPILHMSFSADPSPIFTQKLITWLRKEIHPFVLLRTGLQTNIGAGCVVMTTNKSFDFSLRKRLQDHRELLERQISGGTS